MKKINKYWNIDLCMWITHHKLLWLINVYEIGKFGVKSKWKLRKPVGKELHGPTSKWVSITEEQAIEKFGSLRLLSNPYKIIE